MTPPRQWFRMYAEAVDDEKLRLLAFEDRWHFVALLCLKTMGTLDSDAPHLERRIALKLGLQLPQLAELQRRLIDVGLIDDNWQPIKWSDRQFESDVSTERVRRYRMKRQGNVSETVQEQSRAETEQSRAEQKPTRARGGDSPDSKTRGEANPPPGLDPAVWSRWCNYRREIRKPLKPASIPAAQRALAAFGSDQAAVVEQSVAHGWQGLFALKPNGAAKPEPVRTWRPEPGDDETAEPQRARL